MNKRAIFWTLAALVLATISVNPLPLRSYLVTLAFTFPKTLAFNVASLIGFVMVWQANKVKQENPPTPIYRVDIIFGCFCLIALASMMKSDAPKAFALGWFSIVAPMAALVWMASVAGKDGAGLRVLTKGLLIFAAFVAVIGLYDVLGGPLPWLLPKRPTGILGNRSELAAFCAVNLPLAFGSFYNKSTSHEPRWERLACGGLVVLLTALIVITRSRATWLGVAVMGLVALGLGGMRAIVGGFEWRLSVSKSLPRFLVMGLLVAMGVLMGAGINWPGLHWHEPSPYVSTLSRLIDAQHGTGLARLQQNLVALQMIQQKPLIGFGPGTWRREVGRFIDLVPGVPDSLFAHTQVPNSEWILIATETGLLGLICILVIGFLLVKKPVIEFLTRGYSDQFPFALSLIGLALISAFDAMSPRQEIIAFFAVTVGVLRNSAPLLEAISWGRFRAVPAGGGRTIMTGLLLLSTGFAGLSTWGSYVLMTSMTPSSIDTLPEFIPLPPYAMIGFLNMPILSSNPCEVTGGLRRSIQDYPYEKSLHAVFQRTCPQNSASEQFGQENATWSRSLFFRGYAPTKGDVLTEADLVGFAKTLKEAHIKYAYLFSGPFQSDGSLPEYAFSERAKQSVKKIKEVYPEIKILPWVGGIQHRTVKIDDPLWQSKALDATNRLLSTLPVDGVHLDFEYIMPGDHYVYPLALSENLRLNLEHYDKGLIEFHAKLRSLRPDSFISTVVVSSSAQTRPWKKKHTLPQLESLSKSVNQLSFLYYDTRINNGAQYEAGMREQLEHIKELKLRLGDRAPQYLMAIGTFINEPELQVYRDMRFENLPHTLTLMKRLSQEVLPNRRLIDGLAIYCEWLTTDDEWWDIKSFWTGTSF